MLKQKIKQMVLFGTILCAFLVATPYAASVSPLYFGSVAEDQQQRYWDDLMKYKIWGTHGIVFNKENVHIAEQSGYTGTADGNLVMYNSNHTLGGPILIGGDFNLFNAQTDNKFVGGPARILGSVTLPDWVWSHGIPSGTFINGPYCIKDTVRTSIKGDISPKVWLEAITDGAYTSEANVPDGADGTYENCPITVPNVDTHLSVPLWTKPESVPWRKAIEVSNVSLSKTAYIHIPPEDSSIGDVGTYDMYLESIRMANTTGLKVFVLMPPGGRLTRILLKDTLMIDASANDANIRVVYANSEATFDRSTMEWMWDSSKATYVSNADYAGNLLIYSPNGINWSSMKDPILQGTYMTPKIFTIKDHFTLAGQLIGESLHFESDITGDFRYVPFDPPILNLDPTAYSGGIFTELNLDQKIEVSLDSLPKTDVYFDYCFDVDTSAVPAEGSIVARVNDFDILSNGTSLPVCGVDTSSVKILAHHKQPDEAHSIYFNPRIDGITEPIESLSMKIFNISGAVLPGNKKTGSFQLQIADTDFKPVAKDTVIIGNEDDTLAFNSGYFTFTSNAPDTLLSISITSYPLKGSLLLDNKQVVKNQVIPKDSLSFLRFIGEKDSSGSPYTEFRYIAETVWGQSHEPATFTINLLPVNDPPEIADQSFDVFENSAKATLVGNVLGSDPEKGSLSYKILSGNDANLFEMDASGKITVRVSNKLDYEKDSVYTLVVEVSDDGLGNPNNVLKDNASITIHVKNVNEAPIVKDTSWTIAENNAEGLKIGTILVKDEDAQSTHTYTLSETSLFVIDASGTISTAPGVTFDYETMKHSYSLTVTVKDNGLNGVGEKLEATATVTILISDVNEAPIVKDTSWTIAENNAEGLKIGTISVKDEDAQSTYTYTLSETSLFVINTSGTIFTAPGVTFDYETMEHSYSLTVTVKDNGLNGVGEKLEATATVTILISDVNEAPIVNDTSWTIAENNAEGLKIGTISVKDEDAQSTHTYTLSETSLFVIDASGTISTAPGVTFDYETMVHSYSLTVTVKDNGLNGVGEKLETTATVTINISDVNEAPEIADQSFDVFENSAKATLVGNVSGSDPENGSLSYKILSGNEVNLFEMDASGKITVRASNSLDYEKDSVYTLVVEVSDDGLGNPNNVLKDKASITIRVKNVNEAPIVNDTSWTIAENNAEGLKIGTILVKDEDAQSTHTYTLSETSLFVIDASGTISTAPGVTFDYETMEHSYSLTVTVKDNGLNGVGEKLEATATVSITLLDRNDPPVIADQSFDVFENSAAATLVGNVLGSDPEHGALSYKILSGNDANLFEMDASGKITVRKSNSLDYDTMDTLYTLQVEVSDNGLGVLADVLKEKATISIQLKNVNETPVWNNSVLEILENKPISTKVGTVSATDEDLYESLTYTIVGGSGQSLFAVNSSTGIVSSKAVFDYETKNSYTIDIEVDDGKFKVVKTFDVAILNENEAPVLADSEADVDENVARGTVVTVVTGVDVDSPVLTYEIVPDDDGDKFKISSSGSISVDDELDYETQDIYRVKVVVSDGVSQDTAIVTISINDVNEAPILVDAKFYVSEDADSKVKIGSAKYSDPENDLVSFVMLQDTSGLFKITNTGDIYLKQDASLDYESVKSYVIKVQGSDPSGLADSAKIEIVVTNVIEKSVVKIITAITADSIFPNPETIYINTTKLDVEWTEDGSRQFGDTILTEGLNRIIKEYCVEYKDECGRDTLIVYVNTQTPGITLFPKGYSQSKVSGVTIVEQKDSHDTSFYVNRNENKIVVTVTDPGIDGKETVSEFELTADLQIVDIPSTYFDKLEDIAENWHFETNKVLTYSTVNKDQKASYETKVNGNSITVLYDLHKDSTTALITYETKVNGKKVILSYVVDRTTGKIIENTSTGAIYSVGYIYQDKSNNEIFVSYPVNSKGKIERNPEDESLQYTLSYTYTNIYGNTATKSIDIILDKIPPVVQIISPLTGVTVSSVSLDVRWTVDGIEQDTLTLQSLEKGANFIIRAYRDKAGNETADTIIVVMKNAKNILISMQEPLVEMTKKRLDEFNRTNPPSEEERFGVSLLNVHSNTEEEVIVGTTSGTKNGTRKEPYPDMSGSHLGPTLEIDVKLPSLTSFGGLASLSDLIESDGLIAIEAGGGWDRKKVTVEKYVSDYCSDEFRSSFDITDPSASSLYKVSMAMKIWIYTSLGNFLDHYSFRPKLESRDYVNAAGVVKMFFELKPDASGYLRDRKGRLLGTGAYLFKTEVKMTFIQQCTLPDQTPIGTKKVVSEDLLSSFGYKRPLND